VRFLIVGLGSMGRRRVRNLKTLKAEEILGFDLQPERRTQVAGEYGIEVFSRFEDAISKRPDAMIIATPPDRHIEYAREAARRNIHFFMEASVLLDGLDSLVEECKGKSIVAAPSCTMRFHPSIRTMKSLLDQNTIGKILAFNYHSGQYLPDWHPWEDYRRYYVSKRETGGCREMVPFELCWITWLLGSVKSISCMKGKLSKLDADIDDIYQILLELDQGVLGNMQVDTISRIPYRFFKMISEQGVVLWDWGRRTVSVYNSSAKEWKDYPQEKGRVVEGYVMEDDMYVNEIEHFIDAIRGRHKYMYSLEDDKRILELLNASERSASERIRIEMKD